MKSSAVKIRTSHVGRLPAPAGFEDVQARLASTPGLVTDETASRVEEAVAGIVKRQIEIGIDCIGEGELWSSYGFGYYDQQMSGLSLRPLRPGEVGATRESTRERDAFSGLYADMDRVGTLFCVPGERPVPPLRERMVASGPIASKGAEATQRQIAAFKSAIARSGMQPEEAFIPALAPGWLDHFIYNEHYKSDEEIGRAHV